MNIITLTGNLTRDPDVRSTESGKMYAKFGIGVRRDYKNKNGERETDFVNCIAWDKTAELIGKHFHKGHPIGVWGALYMNKYQDKEGNNRTSYEVNVRGFEWPPTKRKKDEAEPEEGFSPPVTPDEEKSKTPIDDNDLPF